MQCAEEGRARILYPEGKISKKDEVFFNPEMRLNRDVSILVSGAISKIHGLRLHIMDAFSATGVRGIRYALECENVEEVLFNDLNPKAVELIRKNILMNELSIEYEIYRKDARILFLENRRRCTLIDIDPFGTPAPYIDCAAEAMDKLCVVGITATDTAVLCGTYPHVSLRRYGTRTVRFDAMQEEAVRVLTSFIARELGKHDISFQPVVSLAKRHYVRIIGVAKRSTKDAEKSVKNGAGHLSLCLKCGYRGIAEKPSSTCPECGGKTTIIHPVWNGTLFDRKACELALMHLRQNQEIYAKETGTTLKRMIEESKINRVFYDLHFLAKKHSIKQMKPVDQVVERLKELGYSACRTHMKPTGVRTDAPLSELLRLLKGA